MLSGHLVSGSADETADEGFLLLCLDRTIAVLPADPADGVIWWLATEDGETGKCSPRATVPAVAADLDALTPPSAAEQRLQHLADHNRVVGHAEVRPVEALVGPRWLPSVVEVQTEVGLIVAGIGIGTAEGHRGELRAVGKYDAAAVKVRLELLMIVAGVLARR